MLKTTLPSQSPAGVDNKAVVIGDDEGRAAVARGLPEVCEPTAEERAKH